MYSTLVNDLQQKIRAILDPIIFEGARVALLDYPYHTNVGDCLIWLGEMAYLKERNCTIQLVSTLGMDDLGLIKARENDLDFILLHGGGNFGTVWPQFQASRESVIQAFPNIPIIQFPQSVFYAEDGDVAHTADIIQQHGRVTLLVRDRASYDLMKSALSSPVFLCPDMAFMIGPLDAPHAIRKGSGVFLSRTDKEKLHLGIGKELRQSAGFELLETDWLDESALEKWIIRFEYRLRKLVGHHPTANRYLLPLWNALANARKSRGIKKLSQGDIVITDRLHAHILSILLGKPNVVLDNNNKKLSGFHHQWTHGQSTIRIIDSGSNLVEALTKAVNELSTQGSTS
ncbi:MAG: polysaccharide pyruvyl transferase family protein [Methylobacillus glycogenes]|nr:polysaccharide pyruvyl transferase family protein [Methylobacillus glycogenes]